MHRWGDEGVDWTGINDAADYIGSYCRRWGRVGGQTKEKYGTVRFYAHFGWLNLHTLVYPGYASCQFPKWLWKIDITCIGPILQCFFEQVFVRWQKAVYSRAYINACKKWPHLQEEILSDADYPEFIKGCTREEETPTESLLHVLDLQGNIVGTRSTCKSSD